MRFLLRSKWRVINLFFLPVFIYLTYSNRFKFWVPIFMLGMLFNIRMQNFYCVSFCPVRAVQQIIRPFYKGRKSKSNEMFQIVGHIVTLTCISLFLLSLLTKQRIQLFLTITILGLLFSFVYSPAIWCTYICPWGKFQRQIHTVTKKSGPLYLS